MLAKKLKDIKIRSEFSKNELIILSLKLIYINFFSKNLNIPRFGAYKNFKIKNFSKTKIVRRCIYNNRSRGSVRPFNISRIKLREILQYGLIPGWKKAVW